MVSKRVLSFQFLSGAVFTLQKYFPGALFHIFAVLHHLQFFLVMFSF